MQRVLLWCLCAWCYLNVDATTHLLGTRVGRSGYTRRLNCTWTSKKPLAHETSIEAYIKLREHPGKLCGETWRLEG